MVNSKLPLPILKYVKMDTGKLESIVSDYPFYILPRVAILLIRHKTEQLELDSLNFFGYNNYRLSTYSDLIKKLDLNSLNDIVSDDIGLLSLESEISFHDVQIQLSEESNHIPKERSLEIDSLIATDPSFLEKESIKIIDGDINYPLDSDDNENDGKENNSEITLASIDNNQGLESSEESESNPEEITTVVVDLGNDLELPDLSQGAIIERSDSESEDHGNTDELEIEVDEIPDHELSTILTQHLSEDEPIDIFDETKFQPLTSENLDIKIDFSDTLSDEELATRLEVNLPAEDKDELKSSLIFQEEEATLPLELDQVITPIAIDKMDDSIEFDVEEEHTYVNPIAIELLHSDRLTLIEDQDNKVIELDEKLDALGIESTNEDIENDIKEGSGNKDFNDWLANFSQPSVKDIQLIDSGDNENSAEAMELDNSIAFNAIEQSVLKSLDNDYQTLKISRDDELEGVLKDNFFKSQVEIKKASRKSPAEVRIQDEAQMSLQPLDIASETMAILHAQQGNITKAIEIYEKLITLIPEKSSFFALQIQNLRK